MAFAVLTTSTTLTATLEDIWSDPAGTHSFSFSSGAEEEFRVIDDDAVFDDYNPNDTNQVVAPQSTIFTDNAVVASRHKFEVTPDNGDPTFTVYVVFESSTANDDFSSLNTLNYALVSDTPMIAGVNYSISNFSGDGTVNYTEFSDLVVCYAPGTLIDTPDGPRAVETLKPGDLVITLDNGAQPIRWTRSADYPLKDAEVDTKPVQIKADALGPGLPKHALIVSPQHRILVGGHRQLQGWFATEAFAPAKSLTSLRGIRHMKGKTEITWVHFACDRHEIVTANGCLSESLLLGPTALAGLTAAARRAAIAVFGPATTPDAALNGPPARECLRVGAVRRQLAEVREQTAHRGAKEIGKWDRDAAMERYEAERLRAATPQSAAADKRVA
ncbi:Hint domain-containing protein [Roseivivax sp. CAU 1753]